MSRRTSLTPAISLAICSGLAIPLALAADFPSGTFKSLDQPFTVTFDGHGKFHVNQDDKLQVAGSYSTKAAKVMITDSEGPWACTKANEQTGTYTWAYADGTLTMTKVADECVDRAKSIDGHAFKRTT
jgi:hypothetical protein